MVGAHPLQESPLVQPFRNGHGLLVVEREMNRSTESEYRLLVILPDGSAGLDMWVPYEPLSAEGWRQQHLGRIEEEMLQRGGAVDRGMLSAMDGALTERAFYPPVTAIRPGGDGSLWVRREEVARDSVVWDIFDSSGTPVAVFRAPAGLMLYYTSLHEVWGVIRDEFDAPLVVGFEVASSTGSP